MRNYRAMTLICAATLLAAAAPAKADEPVSNSVAKKEQAPKKICKWLPVTGSNMNQKVCLTPEDWKRAEAQSW
ncbi:hypothetical protein LZ518_07090 [Sphingomonas sp. RB56-2]|uniref:Uncharacterized protein n=1 Tax=Sphingomonas brevis TaxID=2908206 RepID=A0ABT0S9T1_9SPHN|nr:hypothetical protein [Sphingomonas brevis]MCL6740894.1 hypothetical protein [Sphingomonas brevis]